MPPARKTIVEPSATESNQLCIFADASVAPVESIDDGTVKILRAKLRLKPETDAGAGTRVDLTATFEADLSGWIGVVVAVRVAGGIGLGSA